MYLGADGKIDREPHRRRLSRAGRAGHGARPRAGAQEVRQAAVEGRRDARRHARRTGLHDVGRRSRAASIASCRARWRRSRRRSPRTASRAAASGRRAIASCWRDLGRTLRAIADRRPRRVLQGLDRRSHRRGHEGQRRPDHQGRISPPTRRRSARRCAARYRGYEIISMPPPSSGGVALIEMLNILEPFDLKSKGLLTAPALHLQIEAMRRAYLDRARHLGDPDFVEVPVARLTSKEHARARRRVDRSGEGLEQRRARQGHRHGRRAQEPDETTHFSVIDRDGMAVTTHLHARRRLRLARRRQGRGVPAEQRDGRLQQEAGRDER